MVEMGGRCIKYIHTTLIFKRFSGLCVGGGDGGDVFP